MHIHLPKPLHSWREFLGEIGIIFIGVLLAIGAEQTIETLHHRSQVHDAIAKLHAESVENRSGLEANVIGLQQSQASVKTDLAALGDCSRASDPTRLVPIGRSMVLVPSNHAWIGVRDSALLPLLPLKVTDSYYKVTTFSDLTIPTMNDVLALRDDAGARVEAIRRGLRDQALCRDAVIQLLRLQMRQGYFLKLQVAIRQFNEEALRGQHIDAVTRHDGLDVAANR